MLEKFVAFPYNLIPRVLVPRHQDLSNQAQIYIKKSTVLAFVFYISALHPNPSNLEQFLLLPYHP
jgi:hypothetical protein